jgi:hypothetical protein
LHIFQLSWAIKLQRNNYDQIPLIWTTRMMLRWLLAQLTTIVAVPNRSHRSVAALSTFLCQLWLESAPSFSISSQQLIAVLLLMVLGLAVFVVLHVTSHTSQTANSSDSTSLGSNPGSDHSRH